ncbi:MAG: hypothetical protein AB8C95_11170 [Phycisphaeraceae bacterium]
MFQVKRAGIKLQLTGRSDPYRPTVGSEWPKACRPIVSDALAADFQNDTPAAYYHLRTALEFLMKQTLALSTAAKIDGTELNNLYNSTLPDNLRSDFPSLGKIYSELSEGIHTRRGDTNRFRELVAMANDHLKAKTLFEKYALSRDGKS